MRKDKSGNCQKCGIWRQSLHRDHILPRFKGGDESDANIQFLCTNCHEDKTRIDFTGAKRSDASRAKMSASQTGSKDTEETRARKSAAAKDKPKSETHNAHVSEALQRYHEKRIAEGRPITPWNKGKSGHLSEETLKKMCDSHLGKTPWNKRHSNA